MAGRSARTKSCKASPHLIPPSIGWTMNSFAGGKGIPSPTTCVAGSSIAFCESRVSPEFVSLPMVPVSHTGTKSCFLLETCKAISCSSSSRPGMRIRLCRTLPASWQFRSFRFRTTWNLSFQINAHSSRTPRLPIGSMKSYNFCPCRKRCSRYPARNNGSCRYAVSQPFTCHTPPRQQSVRCAQQSCGKDH